VLRGNLAPNTAITKPAAIRPEIHKFTGKARVFDCEKRPTRPSWMGKWSKGKWLSIRYEGPKGGPGMRENVHRHEAPLRPGAGAEDRAGHGRALLGDEQRLLRGPHFSGSRGGGAAGHRQGRGPDHSSISPLATSISMFPTRRSRIGWRSGNARSRNSRKDIWRSIRELAESADKGAIIRHKF